MHDSSHLEVLITSENLATEIDKRGLWDQTDREIAKLLTFDRDEPLKTLAFCPEDIQKARSTRRAKIYH